MVSELEKLKGENQMLRRVLEISILNPNGYEYESAESELSFIKFAAKTVLEKTEPK